MPTLTIDPRKPSRDVLRRAADILLGGGLVAFPTETVYGLGANALDPMAVLRIYEAKGRPRRNPLIAHVADAEAARDLVRSWPSAAELLGETFWPGPLTMVLRRGRRVPDVVSAGRSTLAIRVPAHPVALALIRAAGGPIVAPSANPSGSISPTRADHVRQGLGARVDLLLDGGPTALGIESTVVDLTGDDPVLLRPGAVPASRLEALVGPLGTRAEGPDLPSPGMLARHYAPTATLRTFAPSRASEAVRATAEAAAAGRTVGALLRNVRLPPGTGVGRTERLPADAEGYARELYAALHRLDDAGCDLVLVEAVPDAPEWAAVRDRLTRAAAPPDDHQAMP